MAPEVQRGAKPTPAADLYSLGVLLAECGAESTPARRLVDRLRAENPADRPESARLALISLAGLPSASPAAPEMDWPDDEPETTVASERPPAAVLEVPEAESRPGWAGEPSPPTDPEPALDFAPFDPEPTPADAARRLTRGRGPEPAALPASAPTLAGGLAGLVAIVIALLLLTSGGDSDEGAQQVAAGGGSGEEKSQGEAGEGAEARSRRGRCRYPGAGLRPRSGSRAADA